MINNVHYIIMNEPYYTIKKYSDEEFYDYISKVKEREYYDTGVEVNYEDKLLTLQKCIDNSNDKFVVLAKLVKKIIVK